MFMSSPFNFFLFHNPFKTISNNGKNKESSLEEVKVFSFSLIDYQLQYMEMPLPSYLFIYLFFVCVFSNFNIFFVSFLILPFPIFFLRGRSTKKLHGYRYRAP